MAHVQKFLLTKIAAVCGKMGGNERLQRLLFNSIRLDRPETRGLVLSDDVRFLAYCLARRDWSRSQILQDLWVCFELNEQRGGYFVEFGATNGRKNSNTWLLERKLGWTGILAEPNPVWHADLAFNRTACIEHKCVSSKSGDVVTFITTNDTDPELSAIAEFSEADHFAETRSHGERIKVSTISLDDLLERFNAPELIDYISIDTEGSELEILSNYSFKNKFKLISVEMNPRNEEPIHTLLVSNGYKRVFKQFSQWDSWYVSEELRNPKRPPIISPDK